MRRSASRGQSCRSHSTTLLLASSYLLDSFLAYCLLNFLCYENTTLGFAKNRTRCDFIFSGAEYLTKKKRECGNSHKMKLYFGKRNLWRCKRVCSASGTARHHLESSLSEFIWRQHQLKENRDSFESMLNSISVHFPPQSD